MITKTKAYQLRRMIEKASVSLSDDDAFSVPELFPHWQTDTGYTVGDRVSYEETLYKCLLDHKSQASWTPDVSPSLWVRIDDPSQEYPEWVQPVGSTDAYALGAKVSHNGKHWISDYDNNVWEPGIYGWHEVS